MKFTNVKQLIIKFMGGGLINFPTRFLRWVKINGDTDDSDDGGSDGGGSGSVDDLINASSEFEMWIKPEAVSSITNDGQTFDYGIKNSFSINHLVTENAVSVPISNYFHVSDYDVLKIMVASSLGRNMNNSTYNPIMTNNVVGQYSTCRQYGTVPVYDNNEPYPQPVIGAMVRVIESGDASAHFPEIYLWVDPNDYTKCLVEPEDL